MFAFYSKTAFFHFISECLYSCGNLWYNNRAAAQILRSVCEPGDFLMRYGGDEFLAITSAQKPNLTETITQAIAAANAGDGRYPLSLSVGVLDADAATTLDACVRKADAMMYKNKNSRKTTPALTS